MRPELLVVTALLTLHAFPLAAEQALRFDGADDHVAIPHDDALSIPGGGNATIELWLKATAAGHVFGKRGTCFDSCQSCNYQLYVQPDLQLQFNSGGCPTIGGETPVSQWTHVAVVGDAVGTSLYVNGVLAGQSACTFSAANSAVLWLGGSTDCPAPFLGDLDEVRLWNIARTGQQIDADRIQPVDPATPGLVAVWRFEEAADSQSVLDSSPNALHGTLGSDAQPGIDDPLRVTSFLPGWSIIFSDGFE
jgi:hypothetical protein